MKMAKRSSEESYLSPLDCPFIHRFFLNLSDSFSFAFILFSDAVSLCFRFRSLARSRLDCRLEPRLSVPIFLQSCETKSGTESLGSRLLGLLLVGCNPTFAKNGRSGASPIPGFVLLQKYCSPIRLGSIVLDGPSALRSPEAIQMLVATPTYPVTYHVTQLLTCST